MYQFREIAEGKLRLGRPRIVERIGLASLAAGLALLGAPLTGEFNDWVPLLIVGAILITIGIRLCFLYSRITITKLEKDVLIEGYWFRSAFRVKRAELRAVRNHRHNVGRPSWIWNSLQLVMTDDRVTVIYSSLTDLTTQDDAATLARFLDLSCERDTDWKQLKKGLGHVWRALWSRKKRRKPKL